MTWGISQIVEVLLPPHRGLCRMELVTWSKEICNNSYVSCGANRWIKLIQFQFILTCVARIINRLQWAKALLNLAFPPECMACVAQSKMSTNEITSHPSAHLISDSNIQLWIVDNYNWTSKQTVIKNMGFQKNWRQYKVRHTQPEHTSPPQCSPEPLIPPTCHMYSLIYSFTLSLLLKCLGLLQFPMAKKVTSFY